MRRAGGGVSTPKPLTPKWPTIGSTWRSPLGGEWMTVVAIDPPFATLKRADSPKKVLANPLGGALITLTEMQEWTERT